MCFGRALAAGLDGDLERPRRASSVGMTNGLRQRVVADGKRALPGEPLLQLVEDRLEVGRGHASARRRRRAPSTPRRTTAARPSASGPAPRATPAGGPGTASEAARSRRASAAGVASSGPLRSPCARAAMASRSGFVLCGFFLPLGRSIVGVDVVGVVLAQGEDGLDVSFRERIHGESMAAAVRGAGRSRDRGTPRRRSVS